MNPDGQNIASAVDSHEAVIPILCIALPCIDNDLSGPVGSVKF